MNLNFTIKTYDELTKRTRDILIESYRKYYESIYGIDAFDAFLKVTKRESNLFDNKITSIKKYSNNYLRALNAIKEDIVLILFYNSEGDLIGSSRVIKNRVIDVVFNNLSKKEEREYWQEVIKFIEKELKKNKYKKMYIEIPLKEGPLLVRANNLGFIEDPNDIVIGKEITYTLNKDI